VTSFGKDCFGATPKPTRETRALLGNLGKVARQNPSWRDSTNIKAKPFLRLTDSKSHAATRRERLRKPWLQRRSWAAKSSSKFRHGRRAAPASVVSHSRKNQMRFARTRSEC